MNQPTPKNPDPSVYSDETQRRQTAGLSELLRPKYFFSWLWAFIEGWFLSRNYRLLAIGLPFLSLAIGGPLFIWWLKTSPRDALVASYEKAVEQSIENDEPEKTGLYLESLVKLRPLRKQFRHQLVMHYVGQKQPKKAGVHIPKLVGKDGYVPTRLWLLEQARQPEPDFPLPAEEIDRQLLAVLDREPLNVLANIRLADRMMQKKQYKSVENHLLKVVEKVPQVGLQLAKVQTTLQRDQDQILKHLSMAEDVFRKTLIADSLNVANRLSYAEAQMLKGDLQSAKELIEDGRRLQDDPQLTKAYSEVLLQEAGQKIAKSDVNAPQAADDVQEALRLNPENLSLLQSALALRGRGVRWQPKALKPAVDLLMQREDLSLQERILLYEALRSSEQAQRALKYIAELDKPEMPDELVRAELLLQTGQQAEADALLADLMSQLEDVPEADRLNRKIRILLLQQNPEEAREVAIQQLDQIPESDPQRLARGQAAFRAANYSDYQRRLQNEGFENADDAIGMLIDPRQGRIPVTTAVGRLIDLMKREPDFERQIEQTLKQLARDNQAGWQVSTMVGTHYLSVAESDPQFLGKARTYLELAYQRNKSDPRTMNNLALSLARMGRDLERARELVNEAISLLENPVDAWSTRAEISIAEKKWEEAREDLERALAERPQSPLVRRLLVQVLTELGEPDLAKEHQEAYEQLIQSQQGPAES